MKSSFQTCMCILKGGGHGNIYILVLNDTKDGLKMSKICLFEKP